jgi:tRNA(His) guanylyltransferase
MEEIVKKDDLGNRMKRYEAATKQLLPRRTYTVIRVDGRAFHTYTRGLDRPFDSNLIEAMNVAAQSLCQEVQGAILGYVHSDEISVVTADKKSPTSDAWFDGNVQKIASISASIVTEAFNSKRIEQGLNEGKRFSDIKSAQFDSRVFVIPDPLEVVNYLIWRQKDCRRNAISSIARTLFSHNQLHGKNTGNLIEMIEERGLRLDHYDVGELWGRVVDRASRKEKISFTRKDSGQVESRDIERMYWQTHGAPQFVESKDRFLKTLDI